MTERAYLKTRGTDRVLTVDDTTITVALPWWMLLFGVHRRDRHKRPLPTAVGIPIAAMRQVRYRRPRWWCRGQLLIDAPGHNDRWRPTGQERPHRIPFQPGWEGRRERQLWRLASYIWALRPELLQQDLASSRPPARKRRTRAAGTRQRPSVARQVVRMSTDQQGRRRVRT